MLAVDRDPAFAGDSRRYPGPPAAGFAAHPLAAAVENKAVRDPQEAAPRRHEELPKLAHRWLARLNECLAARCWIATDQFSAADIMMAGVLRSIRHTGILQSHLAVRDFYDRCMARPAWEKTLNLYAQRVGASVDDVR
jgi:glutathione S-transferase